VVVEEEEEEEEKFVVPEESGDTRKCKEKSRRPMGDAGEMTFRPKGAYEQNTFKMS
jgi:hypothetical protein